jgi:hypothetical protein
MNRRRWVFGLVRLLAAGALVWACFAFHTPEGVESRLVGKLRSVGFQFDCWGVIVLHPPVSPPSEWEGKWLWTEDPALLKRVETWLRTVRRPKGCENALGQRGGRIVLVFADGRQEEMLFRGPDRPGQGQRGCHGFIWDNEQVGYDEEPFSDFLREVRALPEDE